MDKETRSTRVQNNSLAASLGAELSAQERAKVLLSLLEDQRDKGDVAPLLERAESLATDAPAGRDERGNSDPRDVLRQSAKELLERIGRSSKPKPALKRGAMTPSTVRRTVASLIDGRLLTNEHPSVIAIVIAHQSRETQRSVLKSLPGRLARRVQRSLTRLEHS